MSLLSEILTALNIAKKLDTSFNLNSFYCEINSMYTVIAPGTIRSESKYSVAVSVHKADKPCVIDVEINGKFYNDTKRVTVDEMSTQKVEFDVPKLIEGEYSLKVSGVSGIIFENTTNLNYADHKPNIFIQTDKAKYKPADLVQFRVLVLDENTRPAKIENPINILIMVSSFCFILMTIFVYILLNFMLGRRAKPIETMDKCSNGKGRI